MRALTTAAVVVAFVACAKQPRPPPSPLPIAPSGIDAIAVTRASNRLAFTIWKSLDDRDVALAPTSLVTGLALVGLAARGPTRAAFRAAFDGQDPEAMVLLSTLVPARGLRTTTTLLLGANVAPSPELVARFAASGASLELAPADDDGAKLVQSVTLATRWLQPFDPAATRALVFHARGVAPVELRAMVASIEEARWVGTAAFDLVALPDEDRALETILVAPRDRQGLARVEALLGDELLALAAQADYVEVALTLPLVSIDARPLDLGPALALGPLAPAFRGDADFGGLDPDLFLGPVRQATSFALDERGGGARAVSEVEMWKAVDPNDLAPEPLPESRKVTVVVDRPFLVLVCSAERGLVHFIARVTEPGVASAP